MFVKNLFFQNVLGEAFRLTIESLLKTNEEVPVKVEAAIALQMMLSSQDELAKQYVEPKIREITLELLNIIRQTENDDLTSVMQKIVCTYTEQVKSCDVFKRATFLYTGKRANLSVRIVSYFCVV